MIVSGTYDEKPLIARFDTSAEQLIGRYSIQVGVAIHLNDPTPEGFPTPDEDEQLGKIEATVLRKADKRSVLAGVITTGGMREFVLYSHSSAWLGGLSRGDAGFRDHPPGPRDRQDRSNLGRLQVVCDLNRVINEPGCTAR